MKVFFKGILGHQPKAAEKSYLQTLEEESIIAALRLSFEEIDRSNGDPDEKKAIKIYLCAQIPEKLKTGFLKRWIRNLLLDDPDCREFVFSLK